MLVALWGNLQLGGQNLPDLVLAYQELAQSVSAQAAQSLEEGFEPALYKELDRKGLPSSSCQYGFHHNRRSVTESQKALCPYQGRLDILHHKAVAAVLAVDQKALCPCLDRLDILRLEAADSHVAHQIKKTHFP